MDSCAAAKMTEAFERAEVTGINTAMMRSDLHAERMYSEYFDGAGSLQWIMQIGDWPDCFAELARSGAAGGARAGYAHGGIVDREYAERDTAGVRTLIGNLHDTSIPAGVAGHAPQAHEWVHESGLPVGLRVVCFSNCGSLHDRRGQDFGPADMAPATASMSGCTFGSNPNMIESSLAMVCDILSAGEGSS